MDENIARLLVNPPGNVRRPIETALVQERRLSEIGRCQAIRRTREWA
ncbi:MAG: hypothetical protein IPF87_14010 [Gemmatimonadetes bacterium]|nr:hypothetical protein [Gemmatimonadota bacterium]